MRLVDGNSHPSGGAFVRMAREHLNIALNVKYFGYEIAKQLADRLPIRTDLEPRIMDLRCKPSTQEDLESDWAAYWCGQLKTPVVFHRKVWENAYMLQAAWETGKLVPGAKALGFGCGVEPLPSYLASRGVEVVVTDLPTGDERALGWRDTNQHVHAKEQAYHPSLVDRETFEKNVSIRAVDMNDIPEDLADFDLCWSICALEHVGSIEKGLKFIENSLRPLKKGGVSVHTTEFNFTREDETIDNWGTVLFQRRHFHEIYDRLSAAGHSVRPLDFNVGAKPMDKFIDIPPFVHQMPEHLIQQWGADANHIKTSVDGFPSTCFGIIVQKG